MNGGCALITSEDLLLFWTECCSDKHVAGDGERGLSPIYKDPLICCCLTTWGRHQGKAENLNSHHPGASLNLHYFYFEVYNWLPLNGLLISTWHSLARHSSQSATRYIPDCLFECTITKSTWIAVHAWAFKHSSEKYMYFKVLLLWALTECFSHREARCLNPLYYRKADVWATSQQILESIP